ncbi:MAG: ABC transporter permease [Desulfuromonadales bacterium]|nr:ABC transporter permease [Desulfuromonadales bacterium]MDH3868670.1 ABC transporter permease [Desulfuromonadales bacterium]MDH3959822.1 ABC transporter permease [Desulfuromonadales bacterium]MDH4025139.1 ABC transporter permease [Desulfuromonadales bacterium]
MRLEHIVLHNLRRRKGRAIFLVIGLLIGVATVVTLLSLTDAMGQRAQHELENFGANIIITPRSDVLSLNYGGIQLAGVNLVAKELEQSSLANIDDIPNRRNVATIAPKVLGAVEVDGQRIMMMGVDPAAEFKLKRWWSIAGRPVEQGHELLVGAAVVKRFNLNMGDTLKVNGQDFSVVGLLAKTGSQDDQLLIAPLDVAQATLGKPGQVSMVEIAALCHDCPVDDMVNQLQTVLPGTDVQAVQQVVKTRMHALGQFRLFAWGVAVTVVIIGALLVFVTMMGAISERTREIGIFRAIGYRRRHVLHLVLMEATIVSALAGVLGYLTGVAATLVALPLLDGGKASWQWNPTLAVAAVFAAIFVGLLASLQPAFRASRLEPSEALRAL